MMTKVFPMTWLRREQHKDVARNSLKMMRYGARIDSTMDRVAIASLIS